MENIQENSFTQLLYVTTLSVISFISYKICCYCEKVEEIFFGKCKNISNSKYIKVELLYLRQLNTIIHSQNMK